MNKQKLEKIKKIKKSQGKLYDMFERFDPSQLFDISFEIAKNGTGIGEINTPVGKWVFIDNHNPQYVSKPTIQQACEDKIDLLTQELRWHQNADIKSMEVTEEQREWFCEGIIQCIYLLQGRSGKKYFDEIKSEMQQFNSQKGTNNDK